MDNIKTGNEDLDKWWIYFNKSHKTNTRFIFLLKKLDRYFLTVSPPHSVEEDFPDDGLLEKEFRTIAFNNNPKSVSEKTKIALAIYYNVNLTPWLNKYQETFYEVIEKCLIEGDYERYGIEFEKLIKIAVEKNYIPKTEFMGTALLRGMLWSSRYDNELKEQLLKKEIKKNKLKILIGV